MKEEFVFPQFRKYLNIDVWFKITSTDHFIEKKRVGEHLVKEEVIAHQYPEKLRIQDMLQCLEGRWEVISEEAWNAIG